LAVFAALLAGCATNPATGRREMILIPESQEIALGQEAGPKFEEEFGGRVPDDGVQAYVQAIGKRLAAVSDRPMPYEYTLLRSDMPNAFALPGGKVYVTTGLLSIMNNERELAAVLGHETGHVAALHNVKGLQRQMGASVFAQLAGRIAGADRGQTAETVAKFVAGMVTLKYSRNDEYEADQLGIRYMARAGYNPWGMIELLQGLNSLSQGSPGRLGEMLSTHPLTDKRIEQARATVTAQSPAASATAADPNQATFQQMRSKALPFMVKQPQAK
jgi:predicted Zn-dependent protease